MRAKVRTAAVGGLSAGVLALATLEMFNLVSVGAQPGQSEELTGRELIDALGLEPVDWPVLGCNQLVEVEEGVGYCLDPVLPDPTDNVQASLLMLRVRGEVPTQTDEYFIRLLEEFRVVSNQDDPESLSRREEIARELLAYWATE